MCLLHSPSVEHNLEITIMEKQSIGKVISAIYISVGEILPSFRKEDE